MVCSESGADCRLGVEYQGDDSRDVHKGFEEEGFLNYGRHG